MFTNLVFNCIRGFTRRQSSQRAWLPETNIRWAYIFLYRWCTLGLGRYTFHDRHRRFCVRSHFLHTSIWFFEIPLVERYSIHWVIFTSCVHFLSQNTWVTHTIRISIRNDHMLNGLESLCASRYTWERVDMDKFMWSDWCGVVYVFRPYHRNQ